MSELLQGATYHVEHVVPRSRGGTSDLVHLACACPSCNLRKAARVEVQDPATGRTSRLYNPRTDLWSDHFEWDGYRVVGRTIEGRATVSALELNHARRIQIRQAEESLSLFPPSK